MDCSNCSVLRRDSEEQKAQIARYEAKIKDLVSAYKSLTTEKQSLEVALSLLTPDEQVAEKVSSKQANVEDTGKITDCEMREEQKLSVVEQIEALKQAISTLTLVNKRKEMEFKKDRRSLLEKRDELQNRCGELEQQLKSLKQQSKTQHLKQLRADLAESKEAYEKAMAEHGMVLAELQTQYAKEKKHAEALEKQVTEMSQRLASKDEHIKRTEGRLKQMGNLEQEMETLRKKAEMTPTVRVIKDELANVKSSWDKELNISRNRNSIQEAQLREKESRIAQLEQRVGELSERCAQAENKCIELEAKLVDTLKAEENSNAFKEAEGQRAGDLATIDQFKALYRELLKQQIELDPIAILYAEEEENDKQRPSSNNGELNSNFLGFLRRSVSPSTPVPPFCSKSPNCNEPSDSLEAIPLADNDFTAAMADKEKLCEFCLPSRKELEHFKSLFGHLQNKLTTLEESHERSKKQHDSAAELLRQRIVELENSKQHSNAQLTVEARQKVSELEDELAKQRARITEVIAEKDREIELTKNSSFIQCATFNDHFVSNNSVSNLPMDPQPNSASMSGSACTKLKQHMDQGFVARGGERGSMAGDHEAPQTDFSASFRRMSHASVLAGVNSLREKGTLTGGTATRNIFYEQELSKREQEIGELRGVIRLLELKVRDIEQAMLMKDVQYLQMTETLKEEIRVLEGRLSLASTHTNLAYLRNIFVQFINQGSVSGRRHILKAIGAVLQLTPTEMRRIDRWTY